jgi:hypothetical protein
MVRQIILQSIEWIGMEKSFNRCFQRLAEPAESLIKGEGVKLNSSRSTFWVQNLEDAKRAAYAIAHSLVKTAFGE